MNDNQDNLLVGAWLSELVECAHCVVSETIFNSWMIASDIDFMTIKYSPESNDLLLYVFVSEEIEFLRMMLKLDNCDVGIIDFDPHRHVPNVLYYTIGNMTDPEIGSKVLDVVDRLLM